MFENGEGIYNWSLADHDNVSVGDGSLKGSLTLEAHDGTTTSIPHWAVWVGDSNGLGISGIEGSHPSSVSATNEFQHTGKASLWLGMYEEEYWNHNAVTQKVTVPNGTYNVSFWAWAGGGSITTAEVRFHDRDGGNAVTKTIHNSTSFVEYTIDNYVITNGLIKIVIEVQAEPGVFVRFDDFSITPWYDQLCKKPRF